MILIKGYGFVEFKSEDDADYAIKIMHMVKVKFICRCMENQLNVTKQVKIKKLMKLGPMFGLEI